MENKKTGIVVEKLEIIHLNYLIRLRVLGHKNPFGFF